MRRKQLQRKYKTRQSNKRSVKLIRLIKSSGRREKIST